jgi:hypothetical protein
VSADVAESFVLEIGYRFGRGSELGSSAFNQTLMTILRLNVSSSIFARRTVWIVGQLLTSSLTDFNSPSEIAERVLPLSLRYSGRGIEVNIKGVATLFFWSFLVVRYSS